MTIRVSCPNPDCGTVSSVEEQSLGKRGRCRKCGHVFELARPGGEAASAVSSGDASAWKRPSGPASPTNLPEQFGRYRIMKQIGQGGMGAVYLAFDTRLEREVALKVPYFSPADGPQAVQRFEREARAAATLDHPSLCPVHDVGEIDGIHFLTMPYIKGKPLSEVVGHDQILPEAQAAAIGLKLAQALQEAHNKGIIHRDLKPSNIMMNRRRELIVMDFGLARISNDDNKPITQSGNVLGTALYMAPEQATGDIAAVGPTADIYSLGVILYELLTGRPPFEGHWGLVIGLKNVKDPDPPSKHRPDLSPTLDAICHKAIARDPANRQATMTELAKELEAFLKISREPVADLSMPKTLEPIKSPESLAAQVFAGIITQDASSLRAPVSARQPEPEPKKVAEPSSNPSRSQRGTWIAVSVAGLLGGLLLIAWPNGFFKPRERTIVIKNVPKDATILVDHQKINYTWPGEDKPIEIPSVPGEHKVEVAKDGFRTFEETVILKNGGSLEEVLVRLERNPPERLEVQDAAVPGGRPKLLVAPFDAESASKAKQVWADFLKLPVESSNTLGMKTVLIPPGEFMMGSDSSDPNASDDEKVNGKKHRVQITKPFYLGKTEVTVGQFRQFVEKSGYKTDAEKDGSGGFGWNAEKNTFELDRKYTWRSPSFPQTDDHPVTQITRKDAVAFCQWLSQEEKQTYRLPTEAEWEYSCRAGTDSRLSSGNNLESLTTVGNVADGTAKEKHPAWTGTLNSKDGYIFTAPVGRFLANVFGLYDMHGNVWEWCSDYYNPRYYSVSPGADPQNSVQSDDQVNRGGSWSFTPLYCRSALRYSRGTSNRDCTVGFRVAMSLANSSAENPNAETVAGVTNSPLSNSPNSLPKDARSSARPLDLKMKLIPAGEFDMGSDDSDPNAAFDEKVDGKKHHVKITKAFDLGETEVTVGQFRAFVEKSGYKTEAERDGIGGRGWNIALGKFEVSTKYNWRAPGFAQGDDHPVTNVSWNDAVAFCEWLSKEEGRTYRLPTEAEWEYACRAGKTSLYSSGNDPESVATVGNVADGTGKDKYPAWTQAITARDGYVFTAPVGRFRPNAFGLYDMHGNVWEWCADWYAPGYYSDSPTDNPLNSTASANRVRRGGCWDNDVRYIRTGLRNSVSPGDRDSGLGFRVARNDSPEAEKARGVQTVPEPLVDNLGFKPLFNGKDLSGWITPERKDLFLVEGGAIVGRTDGKIARNEYLITDQPYSDFLLKAKVKFISGNSGIQFRGKRAIDGNVSGPQVDIGQDVWGLLYEEQGRGNLEGFSGRIEPNIREGDWNDFVIMVKGDYVRISLNGRVTVERIDLQFARNGIIGLQVHKGMATEVRFKEIEIKDLSPAAPAAPDSQPKTPEKTKKAPGRVPKKGSGTANPPVGANIPKDAASFGGNRYKLFPDLKEWPEAMRICQSLGGHLVIVNNEEENDFLVSLIQTSTVKEIWLGASDQETEGKWICVDGSRMEYTRWDRLENQPNNDGGGIPENYLMMKSSGLWWDLPDQGIQGYKPGFVCEWEGNRAAAPR